MLISTARSFRRKIGAIARRSTKLCGGTEKSEVQYLSRIGRRVIMCMMLIVALLIIWQVFGAAWG
jgi:hypothetical protein